PRRGTHRIPYWVRFPSLGGAGRRDRIPPLRRTRLDPGGATGIRSQPGRRLAAHARPDGRVPRAHDSTARRTRPAIAVTRGSFGVGCATSHSAARVAIAGAVVKRRRTVRHADGG